MAKKNEPATLTGLAVGDALGMPFETHTVSSETLKQWDGSFESGITNEICRHLKPGQWTDDTKMAKALAISLAECETYSPVQATARYVEWYSSGDLRGIGKTTKEAMDRILKGQHWVNSGIPNAEGNGTAMRAAPIGLFYRRDLWTAAEMARVDARITHMSVEAEEGSAAVVLAVACLIEGYAQKEHVIRAIIPLLNESNVTKNLEAIKSFEVEKTFDAKLKKLVKLGTGAHVVKTVPAAFYCFVSTNSFKEAVELAVRAGGDTDTTAAITGALAGSYYGVDQVAPYFEQLEESEYLRHLEHVLYLASPHTGEEEVST